MYRVNDAQSKSLESPPSDDRVSNASTSHSLSSETRIRSVSSSHHFSRVESIHSTPGNSPLPILKTQGTVDSDSTGGGGGAYIIICTSDDHLEVTLTPSTIAIIKKFLEVHKLFKIIMREYF